MEVVCVALAVAVVWALLFLMARGGGLGVLVFAIVLSVVFVCFIAWAILTYFRKVVLTVDDSNVRIRQGRHERVIGFCDIDSVTDQPATRYSGPGISIIPSAHFAAKAGGRSKSSKKRLVWRIPSVVFSAKQEKEFFSVMQQRVAEAHGHPFHTS